MIPSGLKQFLLASHGNPAPAFYHLFKACPCSDCVIEKNKNKKCDACSCLIKWLQQHRPLLLWVRCAITISKKNRSQLKQMQNINVRVCKCVSSFGSWNQENDLRDRSFNQVGPGLKLYTPYDTSLVRVGVDNFSNNP